MSQVVRALSQRSAGRGRPTGRGAQAPPSLGGGPAAARGLSVAADSPGSLAGGPPRNGGASRPHPARLCTESCLSPVYLARHPEATPPVHLEGAYAAGRRYANLRPAISAPHVPLQSALVRRRARDVGALTTDDGAGLEEPDPAAGSGAAAVLRRPADGRRRGSIWFAQLTASVGRLPPASGGRHDARVSGAGAGAGAGGISRESR